MSGKIQNEGVFLPLGSTVAFFNNVPTTGFKLVYAGEKVSMKEIFDDSPLTTKGVRWVRWNERFPETRDYYNALPIESEDFTGENKEMLLLMPNNFKEEEKFVFDNKGGPLFQRFADLKSDKDIVDFASDYGNLLTKRIFSEIEVSDYINPDNQTVLLESLDSWKRESAHMRKVLELVDFYQKKKPIGSLISCEEIAPGLSGNGEELYPIVRFTYCLEVPGGSEKDTTHNDECIFWNTADDIPDHLIAYRTIMEICNKKLERYGCDLSYIMHKNQFAFSIIKPKNLAAAVWVDFSQTFFKGKPQDQQNIARRCYMCGRYDDPYEGNMHQKKRSGSPFKGLWYHEKCYRNQIMRKRRAEESERRGIQPREHADRIQYLD